MRRFTLCLVPLLVVLGCRAEGPKERLANVLLISVDTLRADHLSLYGYERETSPQLDAFFANGTVFANASSTAPCTIPSIRQYLSGSLDLVPAGKPLAEILSDHGYDTAAVVSQHQVHKDGIERYRRGFDHFDVQAPGAVDEEGLTTRDARDVSDAALHWLASREERPFFLWLHYFDPHDPYEPPEGHRGFDVGNASALDGNLRAHVRAARKPGSRDVEFRPIDATHLINLYDGEIAYTDVEIGRVFRWLEGNGLVDQSLVILTADHGERLGEGARWGHCKSLTEPEIRVPFLVRARGGPLSGAAAADIPVSTLDILPTVVGFLGLQVEGAGYHGVDLRTVSRDRVVFASWRDRTMIRRGPWKQHFFKGQPERLHDIFEDPAEATNRIDELPRERAMLAEQHAERSDLAERLRLEDERIAEQLKQIGYVE